MAVAFFSLFTALGASAFVIRVRSMATRGYMHPQVLITEPPILTTDGPVPVELLSRNEAVARAEHALTSDEREQVARFRAAMHRGDLEVALLIFNDFSSTSPARYVLDSERTQVADDWLATQMPRLEHELVARDCGAVNERVERILRLVPDRHLPSRMACR